jgi:hypothetical protein
MGMSSLRPTRNMTCHGAGRCRELSEAGVVVGFLLEARNGVVAN